MVFTPEQEAWLAAFADQGLKQKAYDDAVAALDAQRQALYASKKSKVEVDAAVKDQEDAAILLRP